MKQILLICISFVLVSQFGWSQAPSNDSSIPESTQPPKKKLKRKIKKVEPWENSWTTNLWFKASATELQKNALSSDQMMSATPKQSSGLLLQENFRTQKAAMQWVFRPSVEVKQDTYSLYPLQGTKKRSKADARINELFVQKDLNSQWIAALGMQNYQWGPAEFMSPSNPIFHLALDSQDATYQARGHTMLRLNYSPDGDWSFVSLFEFAKNEEKDFISGQGFTPKGLIKAEFRLPTPTDYIGISLGNEQMHDPFFGEYANFTFDETFSVYFDIKHTSVSRRFYPLVEYGQTPRMNLFSYQGSFYMLSVLGLRIELDDVDMRFEAISNELGFSETEFEQVGTSLVPSPVNTNAELNQERFIL